MKAIAGSILALAGAVLVAAGTVANALMLSAGRVGDFGTPAIVGGIAVGVVGLAVLALGLAPDRRSSP